jgi:hypothetical protein
MTVSVAEEACPRKGEVSTLGMPLQNLIHIQIVHALFGALCQMRTCNSLVASPKFRFFGLEQCGVVTGVLSLQHENTQVCDSQSNGCQTSCISRLWRDLHKGSIQYIRSREAGAGAPLAAFAAPADSSSANRGLDGFLCDLYRWTRMADKPRANQNCAPLIYIAALLLKV